MDVIRLLLSILSALCLTACNSTPEPVSLDILKEGKPGLWKVTSSVPEKQGSAYLFGTIHILPKDANWRSPELEAAIEQSDRLIIEVLGLEDKEGAAKIFSGLAISPGQKPVEDRLAKDLQDEFDLALADANVPEFALNRMESWAVALSLASAQTTKLGLTSGEGVEKSLTDQFKALDKPIEALETIKQQLGYFDQLPEPQQLEMLETVLREQGKSKQAFEQLFNAWISGDAEQLVKLTDEGFLEDPKIRQNILVARNEDWADQLDTRLQKPGQSFVAVGAAHLVGPDSVPALLEKRGYKIEKIQ